MVKNVDKGTKSCQSKYPLICGIRRMAHFTNVSDSLDPNLDSIHQESCKD